jgi:hypothetical protein
VTLADFLLARVSAVSLQSLLRWPVPIHCQHVSYWFPWRFVVLGQLLQVVLTLVIHSLMEDPTVSFIISSSGVCLWVSSLLERRPFRVSVGGVWYYFW